MADTIISTFKDTDKLVALGLVVVLGISMFVGSNELSMSIASGLIGYIGRSKVEGGH